MNYNYNLNMVVKSVLKEVCIFAYAITLISLFNSTVQVATCDRRLMNEFGLSGMKISIADSMKVCGPIKDKCCTVTDEIKITKLWNTYTLPFLARYGADYMTAMQQIIDSFFTLMRFDPRLIMLKYVAHKEIPYNYNLCSSHQHNQTPIEEKDFYNFHDGRLEYELAPSFYRISSNRGKSFDLSTHTHDERGSRHWNMRFPSEHFRLDKKMLDDYKIPIEMPVIESTALNCNKYSHSYSKEYIIVNDKKSEFCISIYDKFLDLNVKHLKNYLISIKNNMTQVHSYKSSLYCILCNAHEQRYVDPSKKTITVTEGFCKSLLIEKEGYFKFVHILFVEFMDSLLQYVQCFETDAKVYTFPYINFLTKYKRRIPFLRACFDNLDTEHFMTYCWFICDKFDMMRISPFFDGDVKLLRRVQIALLSFIRKMRISASEYERLKDNTEYLLTKENVDGMLIEPLNPGHLFTKKFYLDKNDRMKLLGKLDTRLKLPNKQSEELLDSFLKVLGYGSVKTLQKLKKDHKKLVKKNKRLEKDFKQLSKTDHITKKMKKQMEKRKTSFKRKYSYINGLYNYLWKIKKINKIHAGYLPQRKLLSDPDIRIRLTNTFTKLGLSRTLVNNKIDTVVKQTETMIANNSTTPLKTNTTISDNFVEPPQQLFEKNEPGYNVNYFTLEVGKEGANPLNHFILVDYKFNVTTLIDLKFRYEEDLDRDTVLTYIQNTPKDINEFNFDIKGHFLDFNELGTSDVKYSTAKKVLKYAIRNSRHVLASKANAKIRKFEQKEAMRLKQQSDAKAAQYAKKKDRLANAERKRTKRVIANHHVDAHTFKYNFYDIKGFFVHLFGP